MVESRHMTDVLDESASSSRDLMLARRGLDFIGAG